MPNSLPLKKDTIGWKLAASPVAAGVILAIILWCLVASHTPFDLFGLYEIKNAHSYALVVLYIVVPTSILVTMVGTAIYIYNSYGDISEGKKGKAVFVNFLLYVSTAILLLYFALFMFQLTAEQDGDRPSRYIIEYISYTYLAVFFIFFVADIITYKLVEPDRNKGTKERRDDVEKKYQYAVLSAWVIDLPVLISITICLFIEHAFLQHHLLTGVTPVVKNLFLGLHAQDDIIVKESYAYREMFVSGFVTGAISLHVLMSQIIFFFLNLEFLHRKPQPKPLPGQKKERSPTRRDTEAVPSGEQQDPERRI